MNSRITGIETYQNSSMSDIYLTSNSTTTGLYFSNNFIRRVSSDGLASFSKFVACMFTLFTFIFNLGTNFFFHLAIADKCEETEIVLFELIGTSVIYTFPQLFIFCAKNSTKTIQRFETVFVVILVFGMFMVLMGLVFSVVSSGDSFASFFFVGTGLFALLVLGMQVVMKIVIISRLKKLIVENELQSINNEEKDVNMKKEHEQKNTVCQNGDNGNADLEVPSYKEDDALL